MSARRLLRLLALVLLVLAPVRGMAEGARVGDAHAIAVAMDLGHCDGPGKSDKGQARAHTHCSMSAPGVPHGAGTLAAVAPAASRPVRWAAIEEPNGLVPEATTPPPRHS